MTGKICVIEDFEYNQEKSYFVYKPNDFMLDGDFVLLFDDEKIINIFQSTTVDSLTPKVVEQMRDVVRENEEGGIM